MEIQTTYQKTVTGAGSETVQPAKEQASSAKLSTGDIFKGEIVDLKHGEVTVATPDGQTVTAKLPVPLDAQIGQNRTFTAAYDESGALTLTVKPLPLNAQQQATLTETLQAFGLKTSEENMKLAAFLLQNNMPVTKPLLLELNRAVKLLGGTLTPETAEKALFLLQNGIPANNRNVATLTGLAEGQLKLSSQLSQLLDAVKAMPDSPAKTAMLQTLSKETTPLNPDGLVKDVLAHIQSQGKGLQGEKLSPILAESVDNFLRQNPTLSPETIGKLQNALTTAYPAQKPLLDALFAMHTDNELNQLPPQVKADLLQNLTTLANNQSFTQANVTAALQKALGQAFGVVLPENMQTLPPKAIETLATWLAETSPEAGGVLKGWIADAKPLATLEQAAQRLTFSPERMLEQLSYPKEVDDFLNRLKSSLEEAKAALLQEGSHTAMPETARTLTQLNGALDHLNFMALAKQNLFAQLPLGLAPEETNAELYIFGNKKQGKGKKGATASALIGLDTLGMGRFEVYIQKNDRQVSCRFRLRDEAVEKLVKAHLPTLHGLLEEKQFQLVQTAFVPQDAPFTLLDKEPGQEVPLNDSENRRISFDVRT